MDLFREISNILLVIMYGLLSKAVTGYHFVKDKYLEYKYTTDTIQPTDRYLLTSDGRNANFNSIPVGSVYIEEWIDTRGHKKMIVRYEGETIPTTWNISPFDMSPAKCPWVWVGDKETEIDLTRTFDKFLVPGNILKEELVSKLIKMTDHTRLIYMETGTLKEVEFPGDGITIEADVD